MDITSILTELRLEHEQLGEAILSLERVAMGGAKRRGRPPGWLTKRRLEQKGEGATRREARTGTLTKSVSA